MPNIKFLPPVPHGFLMASKSVTLALNHILGGYFSATKVSRHLPEYKVKGNELLFPISMAFDILIGSH